jgi:hypothetical protein
VEEGVFLAEAGERVEVRGAVDVCYKSVVGETGGCEMKGGQAQIGTRIDGGGYVLEE